MAIRLLGGYETHGFFKEVRESLSNLCKEIAYSDWDITIQPLTAAELEFHDSLGDDEDAINYNMDEKKLIYSVAARHDNIVMEEPADFAQNIFDYIDMLHDDDDLDGEEADF